MEPTLAVQLEAILFYKAEPLELTDLCKLLDVSREQLEGALEELTQTLSGRGVQLLRTSESAALVTANTVGPVLERIAKEELSKDIGKAGLETLAIILYRGPISRMDIDYIRGVNSTFIVRALSIRGLVEKVPNPKDARSFLYQGTPDLFRHLGLTTREELPDFEKLTLEVAVPPEQHGETEVTEK